MEKQPEPGIQTDPAGETLHAAAKDTVYKTKCQGQTKTTDTGRKMPGTETEGSIEVLAVCLGFCHVLAPAECDAEHVLLPGLLTHARRRFLLREKIQALTKSLHDNAVKNKNGLRFSTQGE